jgi:DNA-binding NarL/FixJ family response regulator
MTPDRRELLLRRYAVRSAMFEAQAHAAPRSIERVASGKPLALSQRQTEVVQLMAYGSTSVEIATALSISLDTVKAHVANASQRLGTRNRASSVAVALRSGLIE